MGFIWKYGSQGGFRFPGPIILWPCPASPALGKETVQHRLVLESGSQSSILLRVGLGWHCGASRNDAFPHSHLAALCNRREKMGWGSLAWAPGLTSVEESPVG